MESFRRCYRRCGSCGQAAKWCTGGLNIETAGVIERLNRMIESKLSGCRKTGRRAEAFGERLSAGRLTPILRALTLLANCHTFWHMGSARASASWACLSRRTCWRSLPPKQS
eukprot:3389718-Pleurochrysis_carterae.AAC.1